MRPRPDLRRPLAAGSPALLATVALALLAAACKNEAGPAPQVADVAPDFTLTATDGSAVSLGSYIGKKNVLLYFSMGYG